METNEVSIPVKPKRIEHVEVKQIFNKRLKCNEYIIKSIEKNSFIVLNSFDYFVWCSLDGNSTIEDITLKFFEEFNRLCVGYIKKIITYFCIKGLVQNYDSLIHSKRKKFNLLQIKLPIKLFISFFEGIYKVIGKYIFNRIAVAFYIVICIAGLIIYLNSPLTHNKGGIVLNDVLLIYLLIIVCVFLHELAHALTCLFFNKKVYNAGIMIFFFVPVLYVDTSDMWMSEKKNRILVTLAGPFCDLVIGSLFIIINFFFENRIIEEISFYITTTAYTRVVLNLNPLLKWDGYYALMDILEVYNLKETSDRIFSKILKNPFYIIRLNKKEVICLIYGALSSAYVLYFLLKIMFSYVFFVRAIIDRHVSLQNMTALVTLVAILPVIFNKVKRTIRSISISIASK